MSALALADDRPRGSGGRRTKPGSDTKNAGEGFMNSHAYKYLTELSDDAGARRNRIGSGSKAASGSPPK